MIMREKISTAVIVICLILGPIAYMFDDPLGILLGLYVIFATPIILIAGLVLFFAKQKRGAAMVPANNSPALRIAKAISITGVVILILIFGTIATFVIRGW